jgi:hypothetical protein
MFISCLNEKPKANNINSVKSDSIYLINPFDKNGKLNADVLKSILNHYQSLYGVVGRAKKTLTDSTYNIIYYDKETGFWMIDISFNLRKNNQNLFGAKGIIEGDINGDKKKDLIVTVHTEGGGAGGNVWSQDLFTFINNNEKFKLINIIEDSELTGCTSGLYQGNFRAQTIRSGKLIGFSSCYTSEDPRCCPSMEYETTIAFENNKLIYKSKKSINN